MEDAEQWDDEPDPSSTGIDAADYDMFVERRAVPEPIAPKQHQRLTAQAKQAMQQNAARAAGARTHYAPGALPLAQSHHTPHFKTKAI